MFSKYRSACYQEATSNETKEAGLFAVAAGLFAIAESIESFNNNLNGGVLDTDGIGTLIYAAKQMQEAIYNVAENVKP